MVSLRPDGKLPEGRNRLGTVADNSRERNDGDPEKDGRREDFSDDQSQDQGPADHPRLGRIRNPGPRRAAGPAYDCLAVPLPSSFQDDVEEAVEQLPAISVVVQLDQDRGDDQTGASYVPIDPCQGVVAGLRTAIGERITREFIDLETPRFEAITGIFPDPYALKTVTPERFSAALLPAIPPPQPGQQTARIAWMASRLHELEGRHRLILLVCSLLDWPWIHDAYRRRVEQPEPEPFFATRAGFAVDPSTLLFVLGELPFITGLYERAGSS